MGDSDNSFQFRAQQDLYAQLLQRVKTMEIDNDTSKPWAPMLIGAGGFAVYDPGAIQGTVLRRRNWVFARFQMVLAGWTAPSGAFALRTPWPPNLLVAANQVVGSWTAVRVGGGSTSAGFLISVLAGAGALDGDLWFTTNAGTVGVSAGAPWTWANGDTISGVLEYEVAPGF